MYQVTKILELQLQHSPPNEYSGLISLRVDWFDFLVVQGTLKSLLQHHNLKASVLRYSAFFMVQLSHLHMTTGKTIALTIVSISSIDSNINYSNFVVAIFRNTNVQVVGALSCVSGFPPTASTQGKQPLRQDLLEEPCAPA